jgi:arylsulfatase A-like enzyme
LLKNQGYATCAIGKWHLSPAGPTAHGFDVMIADNHIGQPASYLSPYKNLNLPDGPRGEELTARCTEEALGFIEKNQFKPFFLYLAHFAVHTPLGGKPEVIDKYEKKALTMKPQGKPAYAAMVEAVDDSVGRIRAGLEKMNLTKNTVIIFTGDNGGLILRQITTNLGMRSGKGDAYEGGVRVPFIVLWPGVTKAKTVIDVPVITQDIPTTLAESAGASMHADGVSLMPALTGGTMADRALYWHYPHYHGGGASPYSAIRDDQWKLVHFYENDRDELYDLASDPEEKNDIAIGHEQTKKLRLKLDAWLKETGAQIPQLNPKYQKK